jgi:hypothetical protein
MLSTADVVNKPFCKIAGQTTIYKTLYIKLVLLWAQLTKIYSPLPISVQPISITKHDWLYMTENRIVYPMS